jgi:proline iminopeptidase
MLDSDNTHAWQVLYPPIQRHHSGWLDVGDGHEIFWEVSGNPAGIPALFVHGGPGAGCTPNDRRWFDPQAYRIVLFDQRGAGHSRAQEPLRANTTAHAVADMEALRLHLGIANWLLFGGSWGATLALAYAQQHAARVRALVLRGVFTGRTCERRWLYGEQGAALRHPAAWQRLREGIGAAPGDNLLAAARARLHGSDAAARDAAAQAWWRWEQDLMGAETTCPQPPSLACEAGQALRMAALGVHFAAHAYFLAEGQLLAGAASLCNLPGDIVQGSRDLVTPSATAQALHRAWPRAQWRGVTAAGHASSHPAIARELIAATDQHARAARPSVPFANNKTPGDRHDREGRFLA